MSESEARELLLEFLEDLEDEEFYENPVVVRAEKGDLGWWFEVWVLELYTPEFVLAYGLEKEQIGEPCSAVKLHILCSPSEGPITAGCEIGAVDHHDLAAHPNWVGSASEL